MPKAVLKRSRRHYSHSNRAPGCHDPAHWWLLGRAVLFTRKIATKAALSQQLASSAAFCAALMTWVASCSRTCLVRRSGTNISGRFPALARPARSEFSRFTLSVLSVGCRIFRKPSPNRFTKLPARLVAKSAVMLLQSLPRPTSNHLQKKFATDCGSSWCFIIFWHAHARTLASSRRCCAAASAELPQKVNRATAAVRQTPRAEPLERDFPAFEGRQIRLVRASKLSDLDLHI